MIHSAIILSGGFGTRLRHVVSDVPKPMAPVAGRPFLAWLIDALAAKGISSVTLCTGYKSEVIEEYFKDEYLTPRGNRISIKYSREDEPLGTGGAALKALRISGGGDCLLLNGDTFFDFDLSELCRRHKESGAVLTLALRKVADASRYGSVELGDGGRIGRIAEKSSDGRPGLINGGVYLVSPGLADLPLPEGTFSFEREVLEKLCSSQPFYGLASDGFFIDIGIESDYRAAQGLIPMAAADALFLDRDGVINRRIVGGYVRRPEEFEFLPGVKEAMKIFAARFRRIIVVTNQRGIARGLMTEDDLRRVHEYMTAEIEAAGGRIDAIYHCPGEDGSPDRKPLPGMALKAKRDFPDIAFENSLMAGDSASDMQFARNAGMHGIFIGSPEEAPEEAIASFGSLASLARG